MSKPTKIIRIVVEDDDVTFYFKDSEEPWGIDEFLPDTRTREGLEKIEAEIIDFNHMPEKPFDPIEMRQNERRHEERVDAEHDWAG